MHLEVMFVSCMSYVCLLNIHIFTWEPEGRYCCTKSMSITPFWLSTDDISFIWNNISWLRTRKALKMLFNNVWLKQKGIIFIEVMSTEVVPFWFSTKHHWIVIMPFWLSTEHHWIVIMPFWFSTEHHWIVIMPFWLSSDNITTWRLWVAPAFFIRYELTRTKLISHADNHTVGFFHF